MSALRGLTKRARLTLSWKRQARKAEGNLEPSKDRRRKQERYEKRRAWEGVVFCSWEIMAG